MRRKKNIRYFCLLTDFGTIDPYIAEMKGRIYSSIPNAMVIDLSHEIESQNVLQGALFLERMWDFWDVPSIHIAVVDPGVGTSREILIVKDRDKYLICPNNGLATSVLCRNNIEIRELLVQKMPNISDISKTFHGRDIMVPAGIEIAKGADWKKISKEISNPKILEIPKPVVGKRSLIGEVIYIDKFGNAITNIKRIHIGNKKIRYATVEGKKERIPFANTYGEVGKGEPLCLFGSADRLEISINCDSAKDKLKISTGTRVKVAI
ncbi:MAG: SAM-dependent chlorinase/fluorinase [Candidatus Hydrogenedentes bacterium]|nr:SAM-dependent chlorinase/fluorinase [Candidatus Hydrogenedentota bacterium]